MLLKRVDALYSAHPEPKYSSPGRGKTYTRN
jgi:hypothetical protein